jgi:hypothetical protein
MIDFQSSVLVGRPNRRPCHSPSPGGDLSRLGSGERNLAEPKVAQQPSERARASQRRDDGELTCSSGRQPALIKGRVSPSHACADRRRHRSSFCHSVKISVSLCLCGKKSRNYKTNPIFVASFSRSIRSKEKISNSMISETHQLHRPGIFSSSRLNFFKTFQAVMKKRFFFCRAGMTRVSLACRFCGFQPLLSVFSAPLRY